MKIYTENFTILLNKHITNKEIDTYEFRVMCYLLMLSDNEGTCYPSYKTIADRINISETKAKDSIKKLIDLGLIKKEKRKKADGSASSNLYVVCEKTTVKIDEAIEDITPCVQDDLRVMLTKTIFKDELKQLYDEKHTLRDKIIDEVKEKVSEFKVDIGGASDEFVEAFNELKFSLDGYSGKRNYQFISREQKEKVDAVIKVVCKDDNLQELYRQWCQLQLANQRYYRKHPEKSFDVLEKNKNFERRLQNAVLKTALKDNRQGNVYTNKADASIVFGDIVFSLCKMFEQSMKNEIEEGFTKSIVDSKDKIKEYRRDHGMRMHM